MVISVAFPMPFWISIAYPMVVGVTYPTPYVDIRRLSDGYEGFLKFFFSTVENILSLKRHLTFKRRLHRCRLSDGYLSVD